MPNGFRMRQILAASWMWLRVQLFRLWTALTVLTTCAYLWLYKPEYITWWKRSVDILIERGSAQLPYPWGDRIESDDRQLRDLGPADPSHSYLPSCYWHPALVHPEDTSALEF